MCVSIFHWARDCPHTFENMTGQKNQNTGGQKNENGNNQILISLHTFNMR